MAIFLWFLWCPSHWKNAKLGEHFIKNGGDLKKVGNRIVTIASMNTCKCELENCKTIFLEKCKTICLGKFIPQISYSVHFLTLSAHVPEGYSSHLVSRSVVLSICQHRISSIAWF